MIKAINNCLNDLSLTTNSYKNHLELSVNLTPQRKREYNHIDSMLKSQGVKVEDRIVTLDGHDFACQNNNQIDFITFDEVCYNGAKNTKILCFKSIKGQYDNLQDE